MNNFNKKTITLSLLCFLKEHQSTPEGAINFHEICNKTPPDNLNIAIDHDDVAMLPYSSGTTGKPKGVELTHYSIVSNICQMLDNNFTLFEETSKNISIRQFEYLINFLFVSIS